ncbi:MAG: hypothetical protein WC505_06260 [Patescibacteria group bacterium]
MKSKISTHVDFYLGTEPTDMVWLGSAENRTLLPEHLDIWWEYWGISPFILFPRTVHAYMEQVQDLVSSVDKPIDRKYGWRWDYPDSRLSDWAITCDIAGNVFVSHFGSAWVLVKSLYSNEKQIDQRKMLISPEELKDMFRRKDRFAFPTMKSAVFSTQKITPLGSPVHTIMVTCSPTAVKTLAGLLDTFRKMGHAGSSREISIKDYGDFFFDGDGCDRIGTIVVNGVLLEEWVQTYLKTGKGHYFAEKSDAAQDAGCAPCCDPTQTK